MTSFSTKDYHLYSTVHAIDLPYLGHNNVEFISSLSDSKLGQCDNFYINFFTTQLVSTRFWAKKNKIHTVFLKR